MSWINLWLAVSICMYNQVGWNSFLSGIHHNNELDIGSTLRLYREHVIDGKVMHLLKVKVMSPYVGSLLDWYRSPGVREGISIGWLPLLGLRALCVQEYNGELFLATQTGNRRSASVHAGFANANCTRIQAIAEPNGDVPTIVGDFPAGDARV